MSDPEQQRAGQDLGRKFRRALWFAIICGLVYAGITQACTLVAMRGFPGAEVYDLRPTGLAAAFDLLVKIALIDVLFFLYTIPSFFIRRWLGCALTLLFALLTISTAGILHGHFVAAREKDGSLELCRPWPYEPVRVIDKSLDEVEVDAGGRARTVVISTSGWTREHHICVTVWSFDSGANAELWRLVDHLQRKWPGKVRLKWDLGVIAL